MPANTAAAKASAASDAGEPSEPAAKHGASDPVSSALTPLESALAAALAGALVGGPPAAAPTAASASAPPSASAGDGSSSNGLPGATIAALGNGGNDAGSGALLGSLLTENLAADPKASPSTAASNDGPSTAPTSAPTAVATTAALMAAQLIAPPHVGSARASDSSTMALSSPVGSSAWTDELGAKVTWMAHQGIQSASLQLSPEHLGPLQVTISVHDGQASVWFGAAQADTRTALQQSLPQLRQLFASQGLSLTDTGVSREPPRGQGRPQSSRMAAPVAGISAVNSDGSAGQISIAGLNLLDTYA